MDGVRGGLRDDTGAACAWASAASVSRYRPTSASSLNTARISAVPNMSRNSAESNTVLGKGSLPF